VGTVPSLAETITTSYNIKTCTAIQPDAIGARYRARLNALTFPNTDCDGFADSDIEAYWDIQVNSALVTSSRGVGTPLAANSGQVTSITTGWAEVDVMNSLTGAIAITGSLTGYDSGSGDDLIASWNLIYNASNITTGNFSISGGAHDGSCRVYLQFTIEKMSDLYPNRGDGLDG
jgi:hypothetical protein